MEIVASLDNFTLYYDDKRYNYKLHDGFKVIAYPSTEEDAYRKLRMYTGRAEFKDTNGCWKGCSKRDCENCEKYYQ